jgi:outer membrane protein assembly factor BamB
MPVSVEAMSYYRDRLWVRNVHYLLELDPSTGKRLRLGSASWGWGGMGFQNNKLFVSGIQSQYGTSGATVTDLDQPGEELTGKPTLEGMRQIRSQPLSNFPRLAAMGTPLVVGDLICFATVAGDVYLVEHDGKVRWDYKLGGTCHATPVAADGYLLIGDDDGWLHALRQSPEH